MKTVLMGIALTLVLALGLAPIAHANDEMGEKRAARYYVKVSCAYYAVGVRWHKEVFGNRDSISLAELKRRLPEVRRATQPLARAASKVSEQLFHPPSEWPSDVARPIDRYASQMAHIGAFLDQAASATSANQYVSALTRAQRVPTRPVTAEIRARLGVPKADKAC